MQEDDNRAGRRCNFNRNFNSIWPKIAKSQVSSLAQGARAKVKLGFAVYIYDDLLSMADRKMRWLYFSSIRTHGINCFQGFQGLKFIVTSILLHGLKYVKNVDRWFTSRLQLRLQFASYSISSPNENMENNRFLGG